MDLNQKILRALHDLNFLASIVDVDKDTVTLSSDNFIISVKKDGDGRFADLRQKSMYYSPSIVSINRVNQPDFTRSDVLTNISYEMTSTEKQRSLFCINRDMAFDFPRDSNVEECLKEKIPDIEPVVLEHLVLVKDLFSTFVDINMFEEFSTEIGNFITEQKALYQV